MVYDMNPGLPSLRDAIVSATEHELRGVLLALEGRVVDVGSVQDTLNRLRQRAQSNSTVSPSAAPAKRARHEGIPKSTSNSAHQSATIDAAIAEPGDDVKHHQQRQRAPETTASARSSGNSNGDADWNSIKSAAESDERAPVKNDVKVVATETAERANSPHEVDGPPSTIAKLPATPTQPAKTLTKTHGAPQGAPTQAVPGARGLSWREKQRQKKELAAVKAAAAEASEASGGEGKGKSRRRREREFDFSRWRKRTVAVQLMYEGEGFAGFCSQNEGDEDTVEKRLFQALTTTKLVERITTGDNYSRCGRTDRGVSALGNVVTVSARSRFPKIVDLELPAEPLGTLWIKDAKNSSNGHSTSPAAAQADETDRSANDGGGGGSPAVPCTTTLSEGNPSGSTADRGEKDLDVDDSVGFGTRDEGGEGKGNKKDPPDFKKKKKKVLEAEASAARGGRDVTEINYCEMLNRVLPPDIRALAWAPVSEDFSARFSCSDRTYRYFFLARDLDIGAMHEAALRIVGDHDFRNLCKIDVANVSNFVRHIKHASVKPVPSPSPDYAGTEYYRMCVFEVCGRAFLWHMVRCLMSVLFMVGKGFESPDVMSYLLDLERCPAKPHYDMAPDGPLLLHACRFQSLEFKYTPENLYCLQAHLETLWEAVAIKAARLLNNLEYLAGMQIASKDVDVLIALKRKQKGHSEHYSLRDHGKAGVAGEQRLQDQERGEPDGQDAGDRGTGAREELTWREALIRMRGMGLGPGQILGRKGHMPMAQRMQGLNYDELVQGLGGKKRDRLDRHLAMKMAGEESGDTNAFYDAMQLQGVVGDAPPAIGTAENAPASSTTPL